MFRPIHKIRKPATWRCWPARRVAPRREPATTAGAPFSAEAAGRPQKRPTFAVRLFLFYRISTGRRGVSLSNSLLVLGRRGPMRGPNILGDNSRFGDFNSRLGRREFPVRAATGICCQGLDLPHRLRGQTAVSRGKSTKFPVRREKPGILPQRRHGPWRSLPTTAPICIARDRSSGCWQTTAWPPSNSVHSCTI